MLQNRKVEENQILEDSTDVTNAEKNLNTIESKNSMFFKT